MKDKTPHEKLGGNNKIVSPTRKINKSSSKSDTAALNNKSIQQLNFNHDPLNLTLFQAYYRKSYNLVFEIVENFITDLNEEFRFKLKSNQNYKPIIDSIHNYFSLKIFEKIKTDKTLDNSLEQYESDTRSDEKTALFYKHLLQSHMDEYIQLIRTFSLVFVKKNQKDLLQKLGIYKQNNHKGNNKTKELEIIYSSIPFTQEKLIKENLGIIEGKSDVKSAVYETIKRMEDSGNIEQSRYNPDKIYDDFIKNYNHKPYQELIEENLKRLDDNRTE